jgi:septal ring factor EnvC (AmiA/AmiB activator)
LTDSERERERERERQRERERERERENKGKKKKMIKHVSDILISQDDNFDTFTTHEKG